MENKLNIAELLKDCPCGMELDCALFENLEFDYIDKDNGVYPIICRVKTEWGSYNVHIFTEYGSYSTEKYSKCIIFPKGKTTWEGFQRPFKDGDIVFNDRVHSICIFKKEGSIKGTVDYYCGISFGGSFYVKDEKNIDEHFGDISNHRLATEEEKQTLFDAIKANGYKWNPETKTLEKLPKFKVRDKIVKRNSVRFPERNSWIVIGINSNFYEIKSSEGIGGIGVIPISEQDDWELVPNKFDITTLKAFDKVLARQDNRVWECDFFSSYDSNERDFDKFHCVGGWYKECIPYESNEHLLGTTDDCDEYFKTWE